jgi:hypothetical protein
MKIGGAAMKKVRRVGLLVASISRAQLSYMRALATFRVAMVKIIRSNSTPRAPLIGKTDRRSVKPPKKVSTTSTQQAALPKKAITFSGAVLGTKDH